MIIYQDLKENQKKLAGYLFLATAFIVPIFILALCVYYAALGRQALKNIENAKKFQISVGGEGSVYAAPDIAGISVGIKSQSVVLKDALNENSEKSGRVTAFLKARGVGVEDIKTVYFNIQPQYQYDNRPCQTTASGTYLCPPKDPPKIVGYEVSNTLSVKVRKLDTVGEIIEGSVGAGANEVNGPNFTIDDDTKLKAEAREIAITRAKEKATALARDLRVGLKRIAGFSESGYMPPYYKNYAFDSARMSEGGAVPAPAPSIEPGQNEITASVTIVYDVE